MQTEPPVPALLLVQMVNLEKCAGFEKGRRVFFNKIINLDSFLVFRLRYY